MSKSWGWGGGGKHISHHAHHFFTSKCVCVVGGVQHISHSALHVHVCVCVWGDPKDFSPCPSLLRIQVVGRGGKTHFSLCPSLLHMGGGGKTHFLTCASLLHVQVCVFGGGWGVNTFLAIPITSSCPGGGGKHISHHAHQFFTSKLHRSLLIPVPLRSRVSPSTPLV